MPFLEAMELPIEILLVVGAAVAVLKTFMTTVRQYDQVQNSKAAQKRLDTWEMGVTFGGVVGVFIAVLFWGMHRLSGQYLYWPLVIIAGVLAVVFIVGLLVFHSSIMKTADERSDAKVEAEAAAERAAAEKAAAERAAAEKAKAEAAEQPQQAKEGVARV